MSGKKARQMSEENCWRVEICNAYEWYMEEKEVPEEQIAEILAGTDFSPSMQNEIFHGMIKEIPVGNLSLEDSDIVGLPEEIISYINKILE